MIPKQVYDFELEKTKDVTVLLKTVKGCVRAEAEAEVLMWR